jgi:hypothetical protein
MTEPDLGRNVVGSIAVDDILARVAFGRLVGPQSLEAANASMDLARPGQRLDQLALGSMTQARIRLATFSRADAARWHDRDQRRVAAVYVTGVSMMSHSPPVPNGGVSPFPLKAEQASERMSAQRDLAAHTVPVQVDETTGGNGLRIAVGAAIGSAAIAAAVIYYNRSR